MAGRIRIKLGLMEVEFEGSEEFLKAELLELLKAVSLLAKDSGISLDKNAGSRPHDISKIDFGIGTVAQKLGVSTGPALAMAAAARLTLSGEKDKFSSKDLAGEMRKATAFFKEGHASNLGNSIRTMVRNGDLNDAGGDLYSIPAAKLEDLKLKIQN